MKDISEGHSWKVLTWAVCRTGGPAVLATHREKGFLGCSLSSQRRVSFNTGAGAWPCDEALFFPAQFTPVKYGWMLLS